MYRFLGGCGRWLPVRLRYTGTAKNDAWLHTRCAGLNLRTLLKAGLTRSAGAWVLA